MNKGEKRIEFLNSLNGIKNHMNWCKIKLNPEFHEEINDPRIQYDYVTWEAEDDSIMQRIKNEIKDIDQLGLMELILRIHIMVCEHFVFDDFCYFLGRYDKEKGICMIDQKYGRNPSPRWKEERKKHNKRICFELSRYVACRIKQFENQECDVFLVSDEYETHYATAVISDDFMITIDTDDFFKGEDLNRVKLGLEIKGVTIVSDEKGVVAQALEKINLNRKSKKEFEEEAKDDPEKKANYEWIESLLKRIQIIGNDGIFKYMNQILQLRGYEPKKIWVKDGDRYIQTLYLEWNMGYMVINELGINILTKKEFGENIHEGKYLPNKDRRSVAEEIEYNG